MAADIQFRDARGNVIRPLQGVLCDRCLGRGWYERPKPMELPAGPLADDRSVAGMMIEVERVVCRHGR